jgi:hypothetical protein
VLVPVLDYYPGSTSTGIEVPMVVEGVTSQNFEHMITSHTGHRWVNGVPLVVPGAELVQYQCYCSTLVLVLQLNRYRYRAHVACGGGWAATAAEATG